MVEDVIIAKLQVSESVIRKVVCAVVFYAKTFWCLLRVASFSKLFKMSLVRQLSKANAREAERRRVEEEQANRNISIEVIPNTVPAPDVNSDSFHNMTYTETCHGAID